MTNKLIGVLRAVAALAILGSIYWQVSDRIINHVFQPEQYWVYFTIDTSFLVATILIAGAFVAWFKDNQGAHWFEVARVGIVGAYVVVAVVYNALLRDSPRSAIDVAANYYWPKTPNEILHVWAPIVVVLEVILVSPAIRLKLSDAFWGAAYPIVWLAGSIVRALVAPDHWWPYWFINADKYGVPSMLMYIAGITVILIVTTLLLLLLRRLVTRAAPKIS